MPGQFAVREDGRLCQLTRITESSVTAAIGLTAPTTLWRFWVPSTGESFTRRTIHAEPGRAYVFPPSDPVPPPLPGCGTCGTPVGHLCRHHREETP